MGGGIMSLPLSPFFMMRQLDIEAVLRDASPRAPCRETWRLQLPRPAPSFVEGRKFSENKSCELPPAPSLPGSRISHQCGALNIKVCRGGEVTESPASPPAPAASAFLPACRR